jgi:hypothetical protein
MAGRPIAWVLLLAACLLTACGGGGGDTSGGSGNTGGTQPPSGIGSAGTPTLRFRSRAPARRPCPRDSVLSVKCLRSLRTARGREGDSDRPAEPGTSTDRREQNCQSGAATRTAHAARLHAEQLSGSRTCRGNCQRCCCRVCEGAAAATSQAAARTRRACIDSLICRRAVAPASAARCSGADASESTDADPEDLPSALESAAVVALGEGRNEDAERIAREGVDVARAANAK